MFDTLLWMILLGLVVIFWRDSMRAREIAVGTCKRACTAYKVQLLDDTVSLIRITPALAPGAKPVLRRTYQFDLSETGADRRRGTVTLLGTAVETIFIPNSDETLVA